VDLKSRRADDADVDDTGRILRRAKRLRIGSVATAVMTVGVFGFFLAPRVAEYYGIRTTQLFETLIVGGVVLLVTAPLLRKLKRSVLELHNVREAWRLEAIRDFLTGLFNRRHFDGRLDEEIARSHRHGNPLSLILTDVDHFKKVNDRHGHQAGDAALRELARRIKKMFRREDIVARVGGDEVAILMPDTDMDESIDKAELLRQRIAAEPVALADASVPVPLTISCGVAAVLEPTDSADDLVARADASLYEAKKLRNSVAAVQVPVEMERAVGDK
jgi:diguanylate cyclase (GGDEF)-like protein